MSSVSKLRLIALADFIRDRNQRINDPTFSQRQIDALADFCASQNPLFKRQRWLRYIAGTCGRTAAG